MARDLRSSNIVDLEVRALALGTELIPCELNGRDVYLTAAQIAALSGGGGLPIPWDEDQVTGEVVARTDGTDATPFTIEAVTGQTEPVQVWKDETGAIVAYVTPTGTLLAEGGNFGLGNPNNGDVFAAFDKSDSGDLRRGGMALYAESDDGLARAQLFADAGLDPDDPVIRGRIVEVKGDSANDGHVGFFRFRHTDDLSEIGIHANAGQTDPLLDLQDENDVSVHRLGQADAGFFGASPVAQAAYVNPASVTAQQLGQILIDFGFMAPS